MKIIKNNLIISLGLVMIVTTACEDKDATPESGTISGTVTFINEFPTAETDTVRISIQHNWYPRGTPYALKEIKLEELNSDNKYVYTFNNVAFGTYGAIAVDLANGSPGYNILGVYGGTVQTGFIDADSIVISVDNYAITDLNFVADFSYINSGSH